MKLKKFKSSNKIIKTAFLFLFSFLITAQTSMAYAQSVIPIGKTVGITVTLSGVIVVNTAEFENMDGESCSPAEDAGIKSGDIILNINGIDITSAKALENATDTAQNAEMLVTIERSGEKKQLKLTPQISSADNKYKLGIWIKDSSSGIGTLTCYDPRDMTFVGLGHGISDFEENLTKITAGNVLQAHIASIKRGEKGEPGELIGVFSEDSTKLGAIFENNTTGIKGKLSDNASAYSDFPLTEVGSCDEVTEGGITILSNIEGNHSEEYKAEILKINNDKSSERSMVIKITDERLIEKTGGIVRGMSGSPILQNGKIVGAVTHVFVNDPTRGYGIFIENMLAEAEKNN